MAQHPFGDRVLAQRRADLFLLQRRRIQARRQTAGPEYLNQVFDFLGFETLRSAFDDSRVADLGIDYGGRHHEVVE